MIKNIALLQLVVCHFKKKNNNNNYQVWGQFTVTFHYFK